MDLKIIEKPLFFLGFFDTLRKSLEVNPRQTQTRKNLPKKPLETPWGQLGRPWGRLGEPFKETEDALGGPSGRPGRPWDSFLEDLGDALGVPSGRPFLGRPSGRPNKDERQRGARRPLR